LRAVSMYHRSFVTFASGEPAALPFFDIFDVTDFGTLE
jgi:hypothetical protein